MFRTSTTPIELGLGRAKASMYPILHSLMVRPTTNSQPNPTPTPDIPVKCPQRPRNPISPTLSNTSGLDSTFRPGLTPCKRTIDKGNFESRLRFKSLVSILKCRQPPKDERSNGVKPCALGLHAHTTSVCRRNDFVLSNRTFPVSEPSPFEGI